MEDEDYVCSLDEKSLEKAYKDLNESPKDRLAAVKALRAWIQQESSWLTSPTGNKEFFAKQNIAHLTINEKNCLQVRQPYP